MGSLIGFALPCWPSAALPGLQEDSRCIVFLPDLPPLTRDSSPHRWSLDRERKTTPPPARDVRCSSPEISIDSAWSNPQSCMVIPLSVEMPVDWSTLG